MLVVQVNVEHSALTDASPDATFHARAHRAEMMLTDTAGRAAFSVRETFADTMQCIVLRGEGMRKGSPLPVWGIQRRAGRLPF